MAREKDEDSPKLNILLTESLVSVYVSLLINALATYDCHMLYRLTAHKFDQQLWSSLFGGGVKTVLRVEQATLQSNSKLIVLIPDIQKNKQVQTVQTQIRLLLGSSLIWVCTVANLFGKQTPDKNR